jgi:elongation factor 2
MVNFTIDQIRKIMNDPHRIRNISVIAHVDHGKTTLTSSLIARAGITAANNLDYLDNTEMEKAKGITIKATGVSLHHELINDKGLKEDFLINLIDSPGHVDFSSEVTAALRVTDGALVVVDCVEGVCVQTETVLRQAMTERIRPILMINKVDRAILELQLDGEAIYQQFNKAIDMANVIVTSYELPEMGDLTLNPVLGNVAFGSGKDNWGFSLPMFAKMYAKKFGLDEAKLTEKLWGDNYFDTETKKWYTDSKTESGKQLKRAFVQFIMDPLIKITRAILDDKQEAIEKALVAIDVNLTNDEKALKSKALLKVVLPKWINCADTLLEMICRVLPSPKTAQKYRVDYLYEGPLDDPCAQAIRECDPNGPLMIYISKLVPTNDKGRFYAFGRVFSGTVSAGQKVRIMGPNYVVGKKEDLAIKAIQRTVIMMGKNAESIPDVPCGNTVGLAGIDQHLVKTGTISDYDEAHNFKVMKYSVSPVVRIGVSPKNPTDLPKLVDGMSKLQRVDNLVQVYKEETGQFIIAGCGELHIEYCLSELVNLSGVEVVTSNPIVTYKETIASKSSQECLSKSSNKHNRLYCTAEPISEDLADLIEKGKLGPNTDGKERIKSLVDNFGWDKEEAQQLWTFGPENSGPNMLVDLTKGVQYMGDIRDSLESAFQWATRESVLCEENMRKVRVNIHDAKIHTDPAHRGGGQMLECARRVYFASVLTAQPQLQEPIFMADITVPVEYSGGVYNCLNQRRGIVSEELPVPGTPQTIIKAYLPVSESFGFAEHLRSLTSGRAFPQCVFDHWKEFSGDPLDETSKAHDIVLAIRKRKGLKFEIPQLSNYLDKL